ncbi:hypothetical protein EYF80_020413 [Liparis tanakae]|uniref:Uncharacterized protein n=1 Tax=Liparis tanakae TaxID=230148 RepID=A0A4Z2HWX9_9TELE|nr:hypothetical protein EYF80_020413 [Liparis tanakae]
MKSTMDSRLSCCRINGLWLPSKLKATLKMTSDPCRNNISDRGQSGVKRSMRMACCCEVSCFSSSLYGVGLAGGRDGTVCLSRYCSERNFQISPRCCLGTPVGEHKETRGGVPSIFSHTRVTSFRHGPFFYFSPVCLHLGPFLLSQSLVDYTLPFPPPFFGLSPPPFLHSTAVSNALTSCEGDVAATGEERDSSPFPVPSGKGTFPRLL